MIFSMRPLISCLILVVLFGCSGLPDTKIAHTTFGKSEYYFENKGGPTIVLEAGLSDTMEEWKPILNELSKFGSVFAYNRAGFSESKSVNSIRDGKTIVAELNEVLAASNVKAPYILVGHSLGGAYMELYAKTFPRDIAGVVLVDPNDARYPEACRNYGLEHCDPPSSMPWWAAIIYPKAVSGEIESWGATHKQVRELEVFPQVPLVVLTAGEEFDHTVKERNRLVKELHAHLSLMSNKSKHIVCDECGHYIHQEKPELVLDAVKWVVEKNTIH